MMHFRYRAYDSAGRPCEGEIQAASQAAAHAQLAGEGKLPVDIHAAVEASRQRWWEMEIWPAGGFGGVALAGFMRDLATLVSSRVPLEEALRLLRDQQRPGRTGHRSAGALHRAVLEGAALADAMRSQGAFPAHVCEIVRAGERSGRLGEVLGEIAAFLESTARRRSELATALVYPAILLVAAAAALAVVMTVLIPTILPLYRDAGATPPRIVLLLGQIGELVASWWVASVAAAIGLTVALIALRGTETWRAQRDRLVLSLPLLHPLITRHQTSRLGRTLAVLLGNGVPLLEAVRVTAGALENRVYAAAARAVGEQIETGSGFADALAMTGLFDPVHVRLAAIGERTGALGTMLLRIAEQCDERLDRELRRGLSMLAPVLTLVIGGVVGGLILSVMGAIASLNDLALR